MTKYSILIRWCEEEQEFVATCYEFSGLSVFGSNRQDVLEEAELLIEDFIKICIEDKTPLPVPKLFYV